MERQPEEDGADGEAARAKRARIAGTKPILHRLADRGNLAAVQSLVNSIPEENGERSELINSTSIRGWTILHIATHLPVVEWILSDSGGRAAGFNRVLATTKDEDTALHLAARYGRFDVFKAIVEGCKIENGERAEMLNADDKYGRPAWHLAVDSQCTPIVSWILSDSGGRAAGFDNVLARTADGTALHIAAHNGNLKVFLAIVEGCKVENGERAAMVNAVKNDGKTVLHAAAFSGRIPIVSWILSDSGGRAAGFNLIGELTNGSNALHYAVSQVPDTFFAIIDGCKVENGERAAMLNAVNGFGQTVLHQAIRARSEKIFNWLLSDKGREAGFSRDNLFALESENQSVLHFAAASSPSVNWLDRILDQCSNAEERCRLLFGVENNGWTVLHRAVLYGVLPAIEWIVSHQQEERGGGNKDLFALSHKKESVLHLAVARGPIECFDFLLSRCNNTSERLRLFLGRDDKGWTIFHHAARWSEGELISHILRKYPDESKMIIDARDYRGMTALHRTIISGLDEESRKEWVEHEGRKIQAAVSALLGLKNGAIGNNTEEREDRPTGRDTEGGSGDEEKIKESSSHAKTKATAAAVAAVGVDPNVGLKFE